MRSVVLVSDRQLRVRASWYDGIVGWGDFFLASLLGRYGQIGPREWTRIGRKFGRLRQADAEVGQVRATEVDDRCWASPSPGAKKETRAVVASETVIH